MTTPYDTFLRQSALRKKRIRSLYKKGLTQVQIAKQFQISKQRVHQILAEVSGR